MPGWSVGIMFRGVFPPPLVLHRWILVPTWASSTPSRLPITRGWHSHTRCSQSCDRAYQRILTPYTKERLQSLRILPYTIGGQAVNGWNTAQSNGQESFCDAVKWSSSKNDGQDFLTPVAALTTASMGVSPPWISACISTSATVYLGGLLFGQIEIPYGLVSFPKGVTLPYML